MAILRATHNPKSFSATEWQDILQRLAGQITEWSLEEGWDVQMTEARVLEGYLYPPTLVIQAPQGRLMLELPPSEEGHAPSPRLYAWPAFFRVWLQYDQPQQDWEIWADSRIPLRQPWNKETFVRLAKDLLAADE